MNELNQMMIGGTDVDESAMMMEGALVVTSCLAAILIYILFMVKEYRVKLETIYPRVSLVKTHCYTFGGCQGHRTTKVVKLVSYQIEEIITNTLATCPHPNVIRRMDNNQLLLAERVKIRRVLGTDDYHVFPFIGPDLYQIMSEGRLTNQNRISLVRQMIESVSHLHSLGIVHCDISLENFLVGPTQQLVLIDFEHSIRVDTPNVPITMHVGKHRYSAPELFGSEDIAAPYKTDVYSIGVCIYLMYTGSFLYHMIRDANYMWIHRNGLKATARSLGLDLGPLADLMVKMLEFDPRKRCSLDEAKQLLNDLTLEYSIDA